MFLCLIAAMGMFEVGFMLACHCSTSKVEQSFSHLQMYSAGRKGRTKEENLRRRLCDYQFDAVIRYVDGQEEMGCHVS